MKSALAAALGALPAVALCASVLALGLIAGFLLAAPLTPQVRSFFYKLRRLGHCFPISISKVIKPDVSHTPRCHSHCLHGTYP